MSWEQLVDVLKEFWNQPVPIIGFSVGCCLIFIFGIISKTSFGKKMLNKLTLSVDELKKQVLGIETFSRDKVSDLQSYYEEKIALLEAKKDNTEQLLLAIAGEIHNVKIQEMVEEYRKTMTKDIVIGDIIESRIKDYKAEFEEMKKEFNKIIEDYKNGTENNETTKE